MNTESDFKIGTYVRKSYPQEVFGVLFRLIGEGGRTVGVRNTGTIRKQQNLRFLQFFQLFHNIQKIIVK